MSKPLVYIDQNIIGLHVEGVIKLDSRDDLIWIYSKQHFAEIRRANNPKIYLDVLHDIDAKMLDLILDENWKITDEARLIDIGTPCEHYETYIEATGNVDFDESIFDPLQAWVNGGGDEALLKELPENLAQKILSLISDLPTDMTQTINTIKSMKPDFESIIDSMISNGNDIKQTRTAFGDEKGSIGNVSGEKQIEQIWKIISSAIQGANISCDQFFGFDPIEKQGYDSWPTYLGIISCNAILDILGFQAEKKCRKLDKIPNVRSDSGHIAMGAFCSAILSKDKRLIKRAKCIYEYKNIPTSTILATVTRNSD